MRRGGKKDGPLCCFVGHAGPRCLPCCPTKRLLERACAAGLDRLAASDAEAGSNLVESLRVYVACGGDANAAAERLCQHPNSVRNRVNRARAVLAMEDATDKQLFAYLSMIFL